MASSSGKNNTPLHAAAVSGDVVGMAALLKQHPELIDVQNEAGMTPLSVAVSRAASLDVVKLLLQHGASLAYKSKASASGSGGSSSSSSSSPGKPASATAITLLDLAATKPPEFANLIRAVAEDRKKQAQTRLREVVKEKQKLELELSQLEQISPSSDDSAYDEEASDEQRGGRKKEPPFEAAENQRHYFTKYAKEVSSCVASLDKLKPHLWAVQAGQFFGKPPPSTMPGSAGGNSSSSTARPRIKFDEIRVAGTDELLQSAVTRLMKFALDRKKHLDDTQPLDLGLKAVEPWRAGENGRGDAIVEDESGFGGGGGAGDNSAKGANGTESGGGAQGANVGTPTAEEDVAGRVVARMLAREIPEVRDDPYQVGADGQLVSEGKRVAEWEALVFNSTNYSESDAETAVLKKENEWMKNPMGICARLWSVEKRSVGSDPNGREIYTTAVRLSRKNKVNVPPGTVLGFLTGEYCRKLVYDGEKGKGATSGHFFDPGVYVFSRLCADRSVNAEPLVLLLDAPEINPLNFIGDISGDPLRLLLGEKAESVEDATSSPKARARKLVAQLAEEERLNDKGMKANVELVEVLVRGVPFAFVRTLQHIRGNDELVLDRSTMWLGYSASLRRMRALRTTVQALVSRVGD
eukprot:CAMPEP_0178994086 /NCGR_PEP_ID=MMETSP0795-20121207/7080_1 /TAXON_ID=88552 /ORGANISM="Amoebophrya sp., Strain Ameob2" /LENGTH=637 /DNA_ID=CAMNT_0020686251 /DNA_START=55 /DNA_END=1969 /DNA_ORIENTATION=+